VPKGNFPLSPPHSSFLHPLKNLIISPPTF
jgi:hypothetical protein